MFCALSDISLSCKTLVLRRLISQERTNVHRTAFFLHTPDFSLSKVKALKVVAWKWPSLVFLGVGAILQMWVTSSYIQLWPQLFKTWIALSTGYITIQWISIREINCAIQWIEIYPVDSAIHLLNNQGLVVVHKVHGGLKLGYFLKNVSFGGAAKFMQNWVYLILTIRAKVLVILQNRVTWNRVNYHYAHALYIHMHNVFWA